MLYVHYFFYYDYEVHIALCILHIKGFLRKSESCV